MHPKFEPSSQPLPGNFQPHFQPELNDQELGGEAFTPAGKSPEQLVKRVQQRMKEGKKLTNQEMHWAFSHGGYYFHQQAGVHQQRMRMKEDAERKSGVGDVSQGAEDLKTASPLGDESKGVDFASPVLGDAKGKSDLNASPLLDASQVQQGVMTASPVLDVANDKNDVTASSKLDASQEEKPLSVNECKEAQKENGQVTPLDATKNAVEQPVLGMVQPKAEESGDEKRRKEGQQLSPLKDEGQAHTFISVSTTETINSRGAEQSVSQSQTNAKKKDQLNEDGISKEELTDEALSTEKDGKPQKTDLKKTASTDEANATDEQAEKEEQQGYEGANVPPAFNGIAELKKLRAEIALTKTKLNQRETLRRTQLDGAVTLEKNRIDLTLNKEIKSVGLSYDSAINRVNSAVEKQKTRVEDERAAAIERVEQLSYDKLDELDTSIVDHQSMMIDSGERYALAIESYREELKVFADKENARQIKALETKAINLATNKLYKSDKEKQLLILTDLIDMKDGAAEQTAETIDELKTQLDDDSEVMADEFRDEAEDAADGLGEGSEEVEKKFEQIKAEIIKNLNTSGAAELAKLDANAQTTIGKLESEKEQAIDGLKQQAEDSKKQMDELAATVKEQLASGKEKSVQTLDDSFNDAETRVQTLPDELAASLISNVRATNAQVESGDLKNGDQPVTQAKTQLADVRSKTNTALTESAAKGRTSAADAATRYEVNSAKLADKIIGGFTELEQKADTEMAKAIAGFADGMKKAISEAELKWDTKLLNGKAELKKKTDDVLAENQKAINEVAAQMPERAAYMWQSDAFDRFLDNVGGFFEGLWEGLTELVSGLLTILKWVLIIVAIVAALVLLIAAIALLIGPSAFLAVLGAIGSIVSALAVLIGVLGPILLWVGLAVGVGFFAYAIYEAVTTKGMKGRDRWKTIGKGFFDLITSIELAWLSKLKLFNTASKMSKWESLVKFFGKSDAAQGFVKFANRMVDLAFGLQSKFTGGVKKFQALYQKFKHGLEMEALLAKVGDDAARLEVLLAKAGDDPAKLRKVLRRMSADEFEESMKHYDDVTRMLEDLRNSGNKSDEFVDALRNRRKPGEEPHVKSDEEVKPHDTPEQKPKTDDDGPNNKKDNDEAEKMAALAEAKALLAIANAADEPLPVLQMQLEAVDAQYDAVKRFEYVPKGDDVEVWLIGSRLFVGELEGNGERRNGKLSGEHFDDLAARRSALNLPEAGSADDFATLSKLRIDGEDFYGINSSLQKPKTQISLKANAQTKTHAEAEAVQHAINANKKGTSNFAEMWVDRDPCRACGESNGLGSLARELGVEKIIVHSPMGIYEYYPPIIR